jgi:predicted CoA-binding protein
MTTQSAINDFLSQKKLAIAGVSRNGRGFGNSVLKDLRKKGYEVLPVHPEVEELQGVPAVKTVAELPLGVEGLVLVVPPEQSEKLVKEAGEAGIERVWLQPGAESKEALHICEQYGISCIEGQCVLMHAPPVQSIHRIHRWVARLFGKLPKD